jgi:parallel beta-helix repeat protein
MKASRVRRAAVVGFVAALAVCWSPARSRVVTNLTSDTLIASGVPTAPRSPTAIPGNARAAMSFLAPASNGGSRITGYVVTPYSGSVAQVARVFTSTATTQIIGGLANAQTYTFDVAARNGVGVGPRSARTAPITVGAPSAPRAPRAIPGNASATLIFAAPQSKNGSAITGYTVTPYLANVAQQPRVFDSTATTEVIGGLVNAKTYEFTVAARNARGTSASSIVISATIGTPTAPSDVTARPSNGSATTRWTPPSTNNGSSVTGYTISVYLEGAWQRDIHYRSTATSETITGLTGAGAYGFRIAAQNARGIGPRSGPSCVPMIVGQPDINSQPAGTRFCLSGTHNWTLTPKARDVLIGPATLDGGDSTQFAIVAGAGITNVTLSGLTIRNYRAGEERGAVHTPDPPSASGWALINLQVHDIGNGTTNGAGAELGVGWHVTGGRYYNTRQEGLTAGDGAANFVVDGVEIDHNNFTNNTYTTRAHSCGDEGGGFKFVASNVTIQNSYIHDNSCSGLWSDLSGTNLVITNNRLVDNWEQGVILEISGSGRISHNTVTGNGFHMQNADNNGCGWGWGGGITLSTSGQTHTSNGPIDISFNNVVGNCNGITGVDQFRIEHHCDVAPKCELAHVRVHDNKIVGSTVSGAVNMTGAWQDDGDDLAKHDITFARNTFSGGAKFCGLTC